MLAVAGRGRAAHAEIVQPGNVGRGDVRHGDALSARRSVAAAARIAREDSEHLFSDAVSRLERRRLFQLSRQRRGRICQARGGGGHGYFPHFRFAELHCRISRWRWKRCRRRTRFARRRFVTPATFSIRSATKYSLKYYVKLAKELEKMGAHFLAIKDMAGLVPSVRGVRSWSRRLKEEIGIPIHFHTHDTSGVACGLGAGGERSAAWTLWTWRMASMSGSTSQPNLNSIVAALQHTPRDTGLDLEALNEFSDYWEQVRDVLRAVRHVAQSRQRGSLSARNARRPIHESQGAGRRAWAWRTAGRKSRALTRR